MMSKFAVLVLLCLISGTAMAQGAKVTPLMEKDLPDYPGKEVLMITVEHAPGGSAAAGFRAASAIGYSGATERERRETMHPLYRCTPAQAQSRRARRHEALAGVGRTLGA